MKRKVMIGAVILLTAGLAGCGVDGGVRDDNDISEITVVLNDGRRLPCILYGHGMSCDWANAR